MNLDVRILTGPCQLIVGALLLYVARRLWQRGNERRAIRLARFVNPEGLVAVLQLRPTFFAFGLFFVTQGLSGMAYWLLTGRNVNDPFVAALGSMGAVFGAWSAWLATRLAVRVWRNR